MAFHAIRFPIDIALGAHGGPERATDIVTLESGREERNQRWAQSRRRYNAGYGVKSRADLLAVLAFFEERRGRLHGFLWRDPLDFSTSGTATPGPLDELIGTGDGTTRVFQLVRRYGARFDPYVRPITKPVAGSLRVAVAGTELPGTGFTLDPDTGLVTLKTAPALRTEIRAGFLFDVPVRFDTDRLDMALTHFDAGEWLDIPIIEVRL
jgi:uncharacterized protein (TIGR02217 family)